MTCTLYAAGSNSHGQLGVRDQVDRHEFTRVELPPELSQSLDVRRLACGANHSLLLTARGELFAAGSNQRGQLGSLQRDAPLSLAFAPVKVEQLVRDARLAIDPTQYTVHDVAACWETTFVVLRPSESASTRPQSDVLLSFGANDWGERGVPSARVDEPTRVTFANLVADAGGVRGGADVEQLVRVVDLQAGPRHVCALVEIEIAHSSGSTTLDAQQRPPRRMLLGWGASRQGQLGPSASSSAPPRITTSPQPILQPSPCRADDVCQVSVGKDHTAILLQGSANDDHPNEAQVVLYGSNKRGQLGPAAATTERVIVTDLRRNLLSAVDLVPPYAAHKSEIREVRCTWNGSYLLVKPTTSPSPDNASHRVFSCGLNSHGQLGRPSMTTTSHLAATNPAPANLAPPSLSFPSHTRRLACGSEHVLALLESGQVYGWGWNEHGNLSISDEPSEISRAVSSVSSDQLQDVLEPRRVWPTGQVDVRVAGRAVDIWAGNATSWILVAH